MHAYMDEQDKFLPVREAAAYLRLSPNTLNWWRSHEKGPAFVRIGTRVRYRLSDLNAFLVEVEPRKQEA